MTDIKLKDLFIGDIDGEVESTKANFEELFYTKNSKYSQITESNKFIIAGRKGTGKTILSKYIFTQLNKEKNIICKIFTRHDFKLQQLRDLQYRNLQTDELVLFWKWTFLVQLGRSILELDKFNKFLPYKAEYKLMKFLKEKYPEDIYKINDYNKTTFKKSVINGDMRTPQKQIAAGLESSSMTNNNFVRTEYFENIPRLEKLILKSISGRKESVLIYDDLDELEEKTDEDSNYYPILISMLETAKDINLLLKENGKKKSKFIILLRTDIIDNLHRYSSNSNKLITGSKVDLYWISKNYQSPEKHPLMEMLLNKIKISVPKYKYLDESALYKLLFPKKIDNKEVIDYLINYSYGRPRDLISYLSIVIDNYPNSQFFDPRYFKDCAKEYSKWFYNELENEISISHNREMLFDCLRLINDLKRRTFHYDMIEEYFLENKSNYGNIKDLKEGLKHLYKYGVVGNSWRHKWKKYHYSWGYRDDANSEPNFTQFFVVHYGLRKYFSL